MSHKLKFCLELLAFWWFELQISFSDLFKYRFYMPLMFVQIIGVYDHVIKVNLYKFSYVLSENLVYKSLKSRQCIIQPKGYYFKLILFVSSKKSSFWPILLSKLDLLICWGKINYCELFWSQKLDSILLILNREYLSSIVSLFRSA